MPAKKKRAKKPARYEFSKDDRSSGGKTVSKAMGADHMREIGAEGGKKHTAEHMREIAMKGVERRRELLAAGKAALEKGSKKK